MNARLQRLLLLFRCCIVAALLAWGWANARMGEALLWALLAGWAWAVLMLPRFLLPQLHRPDRWLAAIHAWWTEVWAAELVFSWLQPFALSKEADHLPAQSTQRGVLLLHGFTCNRGLWNDWMRVLRERGHPRVALSMEPAYGSIDDYADAIEAAVRQLEASAPGLPPLIVAHSMGGLAARAWWRRHGRAGRVLRIVTLGTPHAGTRLAHLSHTTNGKQMRRDSRWLRELAASESAEFHRLFDCLYTPLDQIVFPAETAVLNGAMAMALPERGHLGLVFDPRALAHVLRRLDEAAQQRTA